MKAISNSVKHLFTPPVFEDQEKTLMARNSFFLAMIGLTLPIILTILFLFFSPENIFRIFLIIIAIPIALSEIILLHRGLVRLAVILQSTIIWITVVAAAFSTGGIYSIGFVGGTITAMLVMGIALERRTVIIFIFASIGAAVVLAWGDHQGWIDTSKAIENPILYVAVYSSFLIVLSGLLYVTYASITYSYLLAQKELKERIHAESMLNQLNEELEERIAKRTEELAASEERYRLISTVSSDYMFSSVINETGNLEVNWVAGAFQAITGYTMEEYIARGGWVAALHPDERRSNAQDLAILKTNQSVISELRTIKKNNEIRWVRVYSHPIWDVQNNCLKGVNGAVQDITRRKMAELRQDQQRAMLEMVIDLGRNVSQITNLPQCLLEIHRSIQKELGFDRVAIFLYDAATKRVHGTLGTSRSGEIEVHTNEASDPLWYSQSAKDRDIWKETLSNTRRITVIDDYEATFKPLSNGEMSGVKQHVRLAAWVGDEPVALIAADNLISQQLFTQEQLDALQLFAGYAGLAIQNARSKEALEKQLTERGRLINELQVKNKELERFAYTVSHDLKSPLFTIRGFVGYLAEDIKAERQERINNDMERIADATNKMQILLDDILKLSRAGRVIDQPEVISFEILVRETMNVVAGHMDEKGVQIDVASNLPNVFGDQGRLVQVLQNLIDNSIKFMGEQTEPRIKIGQRGKDPDGRNVFFVQDNGIGIAREHLENIFSLFTKLNSDVSGTGIGLATVKRIVEAHGGKLWVESEGLGEGSTFLFTLPDKKD